MSSHEVDLLKWPDPLPNGWTAAATPSEDGVSDTYIVQHNENSGGTVRVEFVLATPLAASYPVGSRDRLLTPDESAGSEALQLVSELVMRADPACRRLVLAAATGDVSAIGRGEAAGYRYVVDVDLPNTTLSLLAAEPQWVLEASRYLDDVPTEGN